MFDVLLTPDNLFIVVAVYAVIRILQDFVNIPRRMKPILSILLATLCVYADWYGIKAETPPNHYELIILGIVIGNAASHAHKILKDTIFGGSRDETTPSAEGAQVLSDAQKSLSARAEALILGTKRRPPE